jgi:hypothetical protein
METQQALWLTEFHVNQTIAAGLDNDIEGMIHSACEAFETEGGPRFSCFVEVWKKTGFGLIFTGRESFREMFEFTEELMLRAKKVALAPPTSNRMARFAGIYLLYSVYSKQPCRPRVRVRLVEAELADMTAMVALAKTEGHWDLVYAWSSLVTGHALHYTASAGQMGFEMVQQRLQREADMSRCDDSKEFFLESVEYRALLGRLGTAHNQYQAAKGRLGGREDPRLALSDPDFPATLARLGRVKQPVRARVVEGDSKGDLGRSRRELKARFLELPAGAEPARGVKEGKPGARGAGRGRRSAGAGRE